MLLIYDDPEPGPAEGTPEAMAEWQAWCAYTQGLKDAGASSPASRSSAPTTATTVRVRDGERVVTDGPFAETKEWLGGYYVIDGRRPRRRARPRAAHARTSSYGHVEVRPVMEVPGM